jgi:hypothetical protein
MLWDHATAVAEAKRFPRRTPLGPFLTAAAPNVRHHHDEQDIVGAGEEGHAADQSDGSGRDHKPDPNDNNEEESA